jgi:ferredoxin
VEEIALPAGAPFGTVSVDPGKCTLCLSCVGACPAGALADDPEAPRLSFQESACVQCGLCRNTCPESAISLVPRLNFREEARSPQVLHEEAPFHCISCGSAFATEASLSRTLDRLGEHPMFAAPGALEQLKLCQDCRVRAMLDDGEQPYALGSVPRPRTTADYLRERKDAERGDSS